MLNKSIISFFLLLFATCSFAGNRGKEQPKYLWFDAEANFERFASKDSISYYLEKAKSVGFNQVVVDVKPIYGTIKKMWLNLFMWYPVQKKWNCS